MPKERSHDRGLFDIRPLTLERNHMRNAEGSCLVTLGDTKVITTATVDPAVPQWLKGAGKGWVTAEYAMLPRATTTRNRRSISGRSQEIQRLIGRSLRAVCDLELLGERTVYVDCDVVQADGGTRVASIIGAAISLYDAGLWLMREKGLETNILRELVAAVSVGIVGRDILVDLTYEEDSAAEVDMNIVMTEHHDFIEIQGTAEGEAFPRSTLDRLLDGAERAVTDILDIQRQTLELP